MVHSTIRTTGYHDVTHRLPAIVPSLPERLSARLFGDATCITSEGCYRRGLLEVVIASLRGDERIVAILGAGEIAGAAMEVVRQLRTHTPVVTR